MKITRTLKLSLLTVLVYSSLGLTGCGGNDTDKKSSAAEIEAFKGNPNAPGVKEATERAKAEDDAKAAKGRAAAQAPPAPATQ